MKKKQDKKGELTTTHLVGLIVLIASFAIILFFIFRLNPFDVTQAEICHNSLVLKDKGKGFIGEIDCRSNYVCVSGNDCESFPTTKNVRISSDPQKIKKFLAEELAQCWWTFGEGKLDFSNVDDDTCARCSIIRFDESLSQETPSIPLSKLYSFLATEEFEGEETYLSYLYGTSTVPRFKEKMNLISGIFDVETMTIDLTKDQVIVIGVNSKIKTLIGGEKFIPPLIIAKGDPLLEELCDNFELTKV